MNNQLYCRLAAIVSLSPFIVTYSCFGAPIIKSDGLFSKNALHENSNNNSNIRKADKTSNFLQIDDGVLIVTGTAACLALLALVGILSALLCKLFAKRNYNKKQLQKNDSSSSSSDYHAVDNTTPIDYFNLRIRELIGRGRFGYVHRGTITISDASTKRVLKYDQNVAVKFAVDDDHQSLLKHERVIFAHVGRHYAVVALLTSGTIAKHQRFCLVMELCTGGSLLDFLRQSRSAYSYDTNVSPPSIELYRSLLQLAWQIASGMKYIHDRGVIHRDLAARNILLTAKQSPKISDFGNARYVTSYDGFYRHNADDKNIPWTISAPEWLAQQCCYFKSDVWSFGVLIWEMLTLGDEPYRDWSSLTVPNLQVDLLIEHFKTGRRLAPPTWTSDSIVYILASCWAYDHTRRPFFDELTRSLQASLFQ